MERQRIENVNGCDLTETDRLVLIQILGKAGYTVRQFKEKVDGKKKLNRGVEFWTEKKPPTAMGD